MPKANKMTDLTQSGFTKDDVEIIKREDLYRGFFRAEKLTLRHKKFEGGWSEPMGRELFVRDAAVVVLVYDPKHDTICLIEQFRVGAIEDPSGPWCLEIVAGMIEGDETPEDVARRELAEEAGIHQVELEYICHYLPSPGGCNEVLDHHNHGSRASSTLHCHLSPFWWLSESGGLLLPVNASCVYVPTRL
jgi:nudix-type nucleoside diphosphatase (YffH/AdpP family)